MNETQLKIFRQICELLAEHFDGHILTAMVIDDHDEERRTDYAGGKANAIGLLEMAKHELLTGPRNALEDDEE